MWMTGLVWMATKYSEAVLGVRFRETDARGENELGEAQGNAGPTDEPRRFWVELNGSAEPDS